MHCRSGSHASIWTVRAQHILHQHQIVQCSIGMFSNRSYQVRLLFVDILFFIDDFIFFTIWSDDFMGWYELKLTGRCIHLNNFSSFSTQSICVWIVRSVRIRMKNRTKFNSNDKQQQQISRKHQSETKILCWHVENPVLQKAFRQKHTSNSPLCRSR